MLVIGGLEISNNERIYLREALIVYLYRALDKPTKPTYFHVDLLDVLVKSAKDSVRIVFGISWANGTSCLKAFNRRSNLDEHPNAPETVATRAVSSGQNFAQLSEEAIRRIRGMTQQKRRQLEAIAAARSLKKLGEWMGAGIVGDIAAKATAAGALMLGFTFFK